jgi:6-phosphogluconolactonase
MLLIIIGCTPSSKHLGVKDVPLVLYVGTYTNTKTPDQDRSKGIYLFQMSPHTGKINFVSVTGAINPSFLVIHPNKKWLYALTEMSDSTNEGAVSAYQIDTAGKRLVLLNTVASHGKNVCHVNVDLTGKFVMAANYGSGTVAVFPINADGSLKKASSVDQHLGNGPNRDRQESPHAHMITQGFDKRFVYSVDLGTDKIILYKLDTVTGALINTHQDIITQPGSGPRHLTFHPNQRWAYLVHELNGTVEGYNVDKNTGALTGFQNISTAEPGMNSEARSADIHVTPDGKFLYASNRGKVNSIAMYRIDPASGKLQLIGFHHAGINWPRAFVIDPTGTFLLVANQNDNNIVTLLIDPASGKLIETGLIEHIPSPVCLKFY